MTPRESGRVVKEQRSARRFLKTTGGHFTIDQDKLAKEERCDGKWVLTTNTELAASDVALKYKQLWMVQRVWQRFDVQPDRVERFKLSNDPHFDEKVRDVVGLYLDPPDQALVLRVDEKSQIQALDRTRPILPLRPGLPERQTHDYKRYGTTTLFAAFNIMTAAGDENSAQAFPLPGAARRCGCSVWASLPANSIFRGRARR